MGRLTKALLITGGMYVAYYLGEITGFIKGAKTVLDTTSISSKDLEEIVHDRWKEDVTLEKSIGTENLKKLKNIVEDDHIDRLESVVDLTSGNLDMLRGKVEDLEERIKILDSAFNYHIMDDNKHGGN